MKVAVVGAGGTLGRALVQSLCDHGDEPVAVPWRLITPANFRDRAFVKSLLGTDALVNCAGLTDQRAPVLDLIQANAVLPHVLGGLASSHPGWPYFHISTDCVYGDAHPRASARPAPPPLYHRPANVLPESAYARAKLLGEPPSAIVLRTSFVAPTTGLWADFAAYASGDPYPGWTYAYWSGSTVWEVAEWVSQLVHAAVHAVPLLTPLRPGVYNLATRDHISKLDLLTALSDRVYHTPVVPDDSVYCDRTMRPDYYLTPFVEALDRVLGRGYLTH